ncbi:DNA-binding domain-containing protein [Salipaludibacillus aurantiacus]|uniref:Two-component system, response regulator YcbB n=1 Tax=Salipaludibacillus aurantiacus TaxID=1601833 RepID=A0A1H9UQQ4_9BACI|nr:DNA-binding domain-containing protein [Salipaludibacillus aurantiacus]SES11860.1 two-component system, response regulator YcbB [Salipaludibacillus aurantiacus]
MRYFIVDDDRAIRGSLLNLLETDLEAEVAGTAEDGVHIHASMLNEQAVDILLIDLLMPERDGIETLKAVYPGFKGKTVMLSQVETKDIIANAYQNGAEAYITKPVNRHEVLSVLQRVEKSLKLEKSMDQIRHSLQLIADGAPETGATAVAPEAVPCLSEQVLSDLGILYEKGTEDLLLLVKLLKEENITAVPPLKELWEMVTSVKTGEREPSRKEMKATEQRVRRAIQQSFNHISSLGAMDIMHPKFEHYGMKFFDLDQLQSRIYDINQGNGDQEKAAGIRVNMRRFIGAFYDECRMERVR